MKKVLALVRKHLSTIVFGIVLILMLTGNLGFLTSAAQSLLLKTGLMNAGTSLKGEPERFDYNFSVKDINGNSISIEQFKGKVIFLNLWATWCGPCRAEMPTIQELYNEVDHDKIAFIMLSLDKPGDQEKVVNYIKKKEFSFPVYIQSSPLPQLLNVPSIPTTFVISKNGEVISENVGTTNFNTKKFKKFLTEESSK